jgi:phage-related protein
MAREFVMGARINLNTGNYSSGMANAMRATDNFGQEIIDLDRSMGRYHDSAGRLREVNGRFAASAGTATRQMAAQEQQATSLKDKVFSLKGAFTALAGSMAIKGAYNWLVQSNADMEQYKNTLTIVLGSQKKAVDQLAWANKFAAQTPFEIPEIIEATTRMAAYGINAKKTLGIVGDMASVMGKDLMQAVEAVADAQTGELERMKEFGITKGMIQDQASKMKLQPFDKKGSLIDQEALNKSMFAIMEKRFRGGMEMQSKTFKGMLSNAQDFIGTLGRQLGKPLFDKAKAGLSDFLGFLNRLQDSGAIDSFVSKAQQAGAFVGKAFQYSAKLITSVFGPAITNIIGTLQQLGKSKQVSSFFSTAVAYAKIFYDFMANTAAPAIGAALNGIVNAAKAVVDFFVNNWGTIKPYIIGVSSALLVYAGYLKIVALQTKIVTAATRVWNAVTKMNPVWLVAIAVGLLIGYLIHLAGGWDVVKQKMLALWPVLINAWKSIWATLQPILQMIGQKAIQIWQWLVQTVPPLLTQLWTILVTWFTNIWTAISPLLTTLWTGIVSIFNAIKSFWNTWGGLIMAIFSVYWTYISSIFMSALQVIWTIVKGAFTVIYNIISGVFKMISGVIQIGWSVLSGLFSFWLNILSGNWQGAWDSMLGMLDGVWSGIKDFFSGLKDLFFDSGVAIIKTLVDGISSMAMAPVKAVTSVFKKVRELLPFSDAHTGPLSQLTHNGGKIVSTMAEGVYGQAGTLHKAMYQTLADTPSSLSTSVKTNGINPAGRATGGSVRSSSSFKIEKGAIVVNGTGKDGATIGEEIIEFLYNKLSQANDILSSADMNQLLD